MHNVKLFTPRTCAHVLATIGLVGLTAIGAITHAENKTKAESEISGNKALPKAVTAIPYTGPQATNQDNQLSRTANSSFTQTGGFSVDVNSRQQAQAFFNSVYTASENTPLTFSGSVPSCSPGSTNALFKDAIALRINWFREMAGVTDNITFRDSFSASAQDAALIMAANGTLTHQPVSSMTCYTASGDDGAGNSNLALGTLGWGSITGYIEDAGSNNAAVGHRRFQQQPPHRPPTRFGYSTTTSLLTALPEMAMWHGHRRGLFLTRLFLLAGRLA